MRQKTSLHIEKINERGKWLRHLLLNMSDEELVLFIPVPNPKIVQNIKKRTADMRITFLARN